MSFSQSFSGSIFVFPIVFKVLVYCQLYTDPVQGVDKKDVSCTLVPIATWESKPLIIRIIHQNMDEENDKKGTEEGTDTNDEKEEGETE